MDERELERLLARSAYRMRLNAALRWACGGVLAGASCAAAAIVAARFSPGVSAGLWGLSWVLVPFVLVPVVIGFQWRRPAASEVAMRLDRAAGLQEHVTTWEEIRRRGLPEDSVARSMALLQREATVRRAAGLRPSRVLPLVLPEWSRGVWLAWLLLGCAVLLPEQRAGVGRVGGAATWEDGGESQGPGTTKPFAPGRLNEAFRRIEILSEPEKQKYLTVAYGQEVPEALKAEALNEIEAKVGGLSEADLSPEMRELLTQLRRQVRGGEEAGTKGGSTTQAGGPDLAPQPRPKPEQGVNAMAPQEALALAREHFPDVAAALHRYYVAD